jgi:ubiquinone/menaquinone biosynthesis C-methylase UbiE
LYQYFNDRNIECEIYVLDITEHDTWQKFTDVSFIKGSAFDANQLFQQNFFDIIFVNYVFHHLVQKTYKRTIDGISFMLASIRGLLNDQGVLCISECYYYFPLLKETSSFLVFTASTIHNPFIARMLRKFGSKSAGVGVCFLSTKKWERLFKQTGYMLVKRKDDSMRTTKLFIRECFFTYSMQK